MSTVIVPLDGSARGEQVIPLARALAEHAGDTLRLTHVHMPYNLEPVTVPGLPALDAYGRSRARDHERAYLLSIAGALRQSTSLALTTAVLEEGDGGTRESRIASALAADARRQYMSLMVMATRGRRGWSGLLSSSVSDAVIRLSPAPVLLLPAAARDEPALLTAPHHILVPLDGTPFSERILGAAIALGRWLGATCTLLHVVDQRVLPREPVSVEPWERPAATIRLRVAQAHAYLDELAARLRDADAGVETRVRIAMDPADAILAQARQLGTPLIALATHGRHGLARLFTGSVASTVLGRAMTPLLIYRPLASAERAVPGAAASEPDVSRDMAGWPKESLP